MILDELTSGINNKKTKRCWLYLTYLVLASLVGIVTGFASVIFQKLIELFHRLFFDGGQLLLSQFLNSYYVILLPALGALIVSLIISCMASSSRGQGVPEVMYAIAKKDGYLKPQLIFETPLTTSIIIGSGGSAGKEGPVIQIGSAIGSAIGQVLKMPAKVIKILVACGAAGGISAAFNAPLGGVIFAQEIILGEFSAKSFILIAMSSVTSVIVSRSFLGNYSVFAAPAYRLIHPRELILYAILGVLAGMFAVLYIKALYKTGDIFRLFNKIPDILKPVLGGLMVGLIGIYFPQIFGLGYETIGDALQNRMPFILVFALLFIKLIATSITLGSGSPGGDFAPGLYMGAMLGGVFGFLVNSLFPGMISSSGAYALAGMGGVLAGQYQAPFTAIIILIEMTNDYMAILPLTIVCIISPLVARKIYPETIYTEKLARKCIHLKKRRNIYV